MAKKLKAHPLADKLPEMTPAEFAALKLAIQSLGGLTDPIVLLDGMILDGRHRQRACDELKIDPTYVTFKKSWGDPLEFVISKASHRNMTPGQKAVAAEAFMDDFTRTRGDELKGRSDEYVAGRFGINSKYVNQVRQIRIKAPKLYDEVRTGSLNVNQAYNRFRQATRAKSVRKLHKAAPVAPAGDWKIILGDAAEQLGLLAAKSVNLIFVDPQYNIGLKYDGDKTGDRVSDKTFLDGCEKWLDECHRILRDDGSIFVMIPPNYAHTLAMMMVSLGLRHQDTIAWIERFGSYTENRLTQCWRPVLWFTKSADFTFNAIREPSERLAKYNDKRANPDGKVISNVWEIARLQGTTNERVPFADAPPQLPIAVPERAILLASNPGDLVVDCFNGNGTTGVASVVNGRRYIGIERSKRYKGQAEQWMAAQIAQRLNQGSK